MIYQLLEPLVLGVLLVMVFHMVFPLIFGIASFFVDLLGGRNE